MPRRTLLCSGAHWGMSVLEGAGSRRSRQGWARRTVRRMPSPALPSCAMAEPAAAGLPRPGAPASPPQSPLGPRVAGCPRWDARWAQQSGRLASPRRREDLGMPRSATPWSRGCCGWSESSAASRRSAGLSKPRHKTRVRPRAALSHESQANNHPAQRSPAGRVALPAPSPGRPAPRGRGGQAGRRDVSPVSHPHLSHAHTCSRARPLSRQCLLVAPAHSAGRNALPGPTALGCPLRPGSVSSSCIAAAK